MFTRNFRLVTGVIAVGLLSACSDNNLIDTDNPLSESRNGEGSDQIISPVDDDTGLVNIVDTAVGAGQFTILAAALQATGLDTVLADESREFTVFAPDDAAFNKLGEQTIANLLGDLDTLSDILLYHVIADASVDGTTAISLAGSSVTTANTQDVRLSLSDGELFVNTSKVTATDIAASNGIIHVIDTVLTPPPAEQQTPVDAEELGTIVDVAIANGSFSTLIAAAQATGLDAVLADTTSTFTVFAPTDDAFAALPAGTLTALLEDPDSLRQILLYHVVSGAAVNAETAISLAGTSVTTANGADVKVALREGELFINDSKVIITDVQASNGIIHVIDTVLLPPPQAAPSGESVADTDNDISTATILDVAREAGFSTLVAAIEATGLDTALGHPDDIYTVFAPTDAAFAALGQDTINALLEDPDTLKDILLYHVLPGVVISGEQATGLIGIDIQAGNTDIVRLSQRDSGLFINDSRIVTTDVQAVNGVIHVIDAVLIPPM